MLAVRRYRGLLKGLPFILWWREFYFICSQDGRTRCPKHDAAHSFNSFVTTWKLFRWYSCFDGNPFNLCVHAARPIRRTTMTTTAIIQRLILWERSVFSLMSRSTHTCLFDKIITRYFCRSSRKDEFSVFKWYFICASKFIEINISPKCRRFDAFWLFRMIFHFDNCYLFEIIVCKAQIMEFCEMRPGLSPTHQMENANRAIRIAITL